MKMLTILMVAEKPSLAQSLATILSNGNYRTRKAFNNACSVHEYNGSFRGKSSLFKFTSVCGHVMSTNFKGPYKNWNAVEPHELFDVPIIKEEANPNLKIPQFLEREGRKCDYLILWLDCDKEGENICFEVIHVLSPVMQICTSGKAQNVFRAKFSAITEHDIKYAMNNLISPNELESLSVDARQELDLRIGCAFTRFQTQFFHGKYGDLDSSVISFGPCQTPTLAFCVDRHDKIQTFKPEPFWVLNVIVRSADNDSSPPMTLEWERGREFNHSVAKSYLNAVKSQKRAKIMKISTKEKSKPRPMALNTVELMKIASSGLGMGPHHAMQIAERLYIQGYISYPRTETTSYPKNFDLIGTLKLQCSSPDWGKEVTELYNTGIVRPRQGHDAGDHPPITPMKSAAQTDLSDRDSWRIYEYITRHFIASISSDMRYEQTSIVFSIGSEKFSKDGIQILDRGFTVFMPWQSQNDQKLPSNPKVGDEYLIVDVKLNEKMTSPPDYLTESELISLMEKHGIGTDASIPTHINNISVRNYAKVSQGRRLIPTQLGIVLIHGYQKIDNDLVLPTRRAEIEKQLNEIAMGRADFRSVLKSTINDFEKKFTFFVENINAMDELFEVSFSSLADSGKPISRCGKCRRYIKLIIAKPQRLYCPTCNETLTIPQSGNIKIYKELKCPIDEYELLYYYRGTDKSYVFCPNCYNNPPFESMTKGSGCNLCPHQTCVQSMTINGIAPCLNCNKSGTLVLDPGSGPPKWKIGCNKCTFSLTAFKDASKVSIEDELCSKCNKKIISVEYKEDKSKLSNGANIFRDCLWCADEFSALVNLMSQMRVTNFNNDYGHSRGGSRGAHHNFSRGGGGGGAFNNRGHGRGNSFGRGRPSGRRGRARRGGGGRGHSGDDYSMGHPKASMQLSDYF